MKTNQDKNIIRIVPNIWVAAGQKFILGLKQAKQTLADEYQAQLPERLFQSAVNEAETLAWETEYPQLVFPTLAEEKIEELRNICGQTQDSGYALAI